MFFPVVTAKVYSIQHYVMKFVSDLRQVSIQHYVMKFVSDLRQVSIQHYVMKFVSDLRQVGRFSLGSVVSSINKTDSQNITEMLLIVALTTITLTLLL